MPSHTSWWFLCQFLPSVDENSSDSEDPNPRTYHILTEINKKFEEAVSFSYNLFQLDSSKINEKNYNVLRLSVPDQQSVINGLAFQIGGLGFFSPSGYKLVALVVLNTCWYPIWASLLTSTLPWFFRLDSNKLNLTNLRLWKVFVE